jgi:hypothetical protein
MIQFGEIQLEILNLVNSEGFDRSKLLSCVSTYLKSKYSGEKISKEIKRKESLNLGVYYERLFDIKNESKSNVGKAQAQSIWNDIETKTELDIPSIGLSRVPIVRFLFLKLVKVKGR